MYHQMHLLCKSTRDQKWQISNTAPPPSSTCGHYLQKREAGRISTRIKQLDVDCETKSKDHGMLSCSMVPLKPPRSLWTNHFTLFFVCFVDASPGRIRALSGRCPCILCASSVHPRPCLDTVSNEFHASIRIILLPVVSDSSIDVSRSRHDPIDHAATRFGRHLLRPGYDII